MIWFERGEKTEEEPGRFLPGEDSLEANDEAGSIRFHAGGSEQTMGISGTTRGDDAKGSIDPVDWLRYYVKTLESRKVQELEPVLFKAWINLLCVARIYDGVFPSCDEIGFRLRCSAEQAGRWLAELIARGFIEADSEGRTVPHDWDEHQYRSDDVTSRVQKHRMKQAGNVSRNVTRNRDETPSDTDTDTDTDTEQNAHDMTSVADTAPSITTKSEVVKPLPRPPLLISDSNGSGIVPWRTDQHFVNFELDYLKLAQHFIDEDFEDAYENCWKRLALPEKLERIAGLNKHSAEYSEDPRFVPKPRKFLETEWKRPLKPKATKATTRAMTATEEARIVWEKTRGKRNRTRTGAD